MSHSCSSNTGTSSKKASNTQMSMSHYELSTFCTSWDSDDGVSGYVLSTYLGEYFAHIWSGDRKMIVSYSSWDMMLDEAKVFVVSSLRDHSDLHKVRTKLFLQVIARQEESDFLFPPADLYRDIVDELLGDWEGTIGVGIKYMGAHVLNSGFDCETLLTVSGDGSLSFTQCGTVIRTIRDFEDHDCYRKVRDFMIANNFRLQ